MKRISLLWIILILLTACGYKNDLKPPINFEKSIKVQNQKLKVLEKKRLYQPYRSIISLDTKIRKDALIVGVGRYKNNVETLYGVKKDVKRVRKLLNYFDVNKILTLEDSRATLYAVRKEFYRYIHSKKNAKGNTFIFYYSGHGVQVLDKNGDESDKKDEATALYDFEINKSKVITKGVLLDDELYTLLAQIKSKKILIFDKCHSGSSHRNYNVFVKSINGDYKVSSKLLKSINRKKVAKKIKNFIIFSATKDNQKAEDSPDGGLFTKSFIDGILKKKADRNRDKKITLLELKQFCKSSIPVLANYLNKKYKLKLKGSAEPLFISSWGLHKNITFIFD
jgi:hypothetical protein